MTSSPGISGIKRRREPLRVTNVEELARSSHAQPSRDARIAWANDFPENFEVLLKIGEGSFGTVWSARRKGPRPRQGGGLGEGEENRALMALKRINPTCSPSRILNEFEQMRKLGGRHNVVQVQGVIRTPGGAFALVMPFFEHDEFRDYMKTLTLSGVAAYMRSLLTALAHVHAEGVIHRDIKPRNFMYSAKSCEGLLIDFGLAEPAHKWKDRAEALVNHRDRRRSKAQGKGESRGTSRPTPKHKRKNGVSSSGRSARDLESPHQHLHNTSPGEISGKLPSGNREYSAEASIAGKSEGDDRLRLLRKVERGGTTGFRAPEILWHSRDQEPAVDVWAAGVILLCLLSRRYPLFPSADNDEMALVQISALLGADEIRSAARRSGRCEITEFPSTALRRGSVEGLCAPLLGGVPCDEEEGRARANALCLVKGMLKVNPTERLSAQEALVHPFVGEA